MDKKIGFDSGVSDPALQHCEKRDAFMMVHGDDFITLGDSEALSEVERAMSDHYTIKVRAILGAGRDDAKEVRILNRYVRWDSDGGRNWIEYEPDPRHAELIVKSLNLESVKGVTTPPVKKRLEDVLTTSPQLDALQTRKYRSVVMRAAYLSQDRPGLSYSTKELARDMQKPTEQSMTNLKRLGRYLKKPPRLVQLFVEQTSTTHVVRLDVCGDSDHAGCLKTRKSTTGMVLMRDAHCLKVPSHTPSTISLSSGESEYGIVKCAAIGLGARSMLSDFGMCADSSSGLAVGSRRGSGRLRHVQTRFLWVQQRVQQGDLRLKEESGDTNVSDALTKPLDEKRMTNLFDGLRVQRRAYSIGAGSAVTNCRLKSSTSLRRIASCFFFKKKKQSILFSAVWCFQQQDFLKQAELRSGTLERE